MFNPLHTLKVFHANAQCDAYYDTWGSPITYTYTRAYVSAFIYQVQRFVCYHVVCKLRGHDIVDRSAAGPESGNMDHACQRCDAYWSVPLY